MIRPEDLVCDVLDKYPAAWPIFERHGMCEDCKQSPPPVPVHHFVTKHCNGNIDAFLQEIHETVSG
ncbi:MAG: hypothetical protein ACP5I1_15520 [Candidatus Hinthialibacter sp.]